MVKRALAMPVEQRRVRVVGLLRALVMSAAVFAGVVTLLVQVAPAALATHAKGANSGYLASLSWRVCNTGTQAGRDAVVDAMQRIENNTTVTANGGYCDGNKNVNAHSDSYAESWYGLTNCTSWVGGDFQCGFKTVALNQRTITSTSDPGRQWNKTGRHEFGHVGGLGHRTDNDSAMKQGESPPVSAFFDSHDWNALNNTYP